MCQKRRLLADDLNSCQFSPEKEGGGGGVSADCIAYCLLQLVIFFAQ